MHLNVKRSKGLGPQEGVDSFPASPPHPGKTPRNSEIGKTTAACGLAGESLEGKQSWRERETRKGKWEGAE